MFQHNHQRAAGKWPQFWGARDFRGGIVLIALALLAVWAARDLSGMEDGSFGPGTLPRLYAGLLAVLGVALCIAGIVRPTQAAERFRWRGLVSVVVAILSFAGIVRPFGLIVASFVAFLIGALGSRETRWLEAVAAAAVLTGFCALLFVYFLKLPFRLWPF